MKSTRYLVLLSVSLAVTAPISATMYNESITVTPPATKQQLPLPSMKFFDLRIWLQAISTGSDLIVNTQGNRDGRTVNVTSAGASINLGNIDSTTNRAGLLPAGWAMLTRFWDSFSWLQKPTKASTNQQQQNWQNYLTSHNIVSIIALQAAIDQIAAGSANLASARADIVNHISKQTPAVQNAFQDASKKVIKLTPAVGALNDVIIAQSVKQFMPSPVKNKKIKTSKGML